MCRPTQREGVGAYEVLPLRKKKGGGHKMFWGSFYPVAYPSLDFEPY